MIRVAFAVLLLGSLAAWGQDAPPTIDFAKDVKPILAERCYSCHGLEKRKNGLRLDVREDGLRGGDSGKVIVAGDPDNSLLIKLVTGGDEKRIMPPQGDRLTDAQIAILKAWVQQGAVWPDDHAGEAVVNVDHWAFKAPQRPAAPAVDTYRVGAQSHRCIHPFATRSTESQAIARGRSRDVDPAFALRSHRHSAKSG